MKNATIATSVLMLIGSAVAGPMKHMHHRRNVAYQTTTVYETVYYTSTVWIKPRKTPNADVANQANAAPTPPAAILVKSPSEDNIAAAAPTPPPAPSPQEDANAAQQAANIKAQEEYRKEVDRKNKEQEKKNKEQEEKNRQQAEKNQGKNNSNNKGEPVEEEQAAPPPPPPVVEAPEPPKSNKNVAAVSDGGSFSGELTYYDAGMGACGVSNTNDEFICAVGKGYFEPHTPNGNPNKNSLCGKKIEISYNGKKAHCIVQDCCPGCAGTHDLDVTLKVFEQLADQATGRIDGAVWKFVN